MAMQPAVRYSLIVLLVLALFLSLFLLAKAAKPSQTIITPGEPPKQGLGAGLFSTIWQNLSNSNFWSNIFKGGNVACDPNNKGYNIDGIKDSNCGADYTNCDSSKCDPSNNGYNECGFPDINCGFGG